MSTEENKAVVRRFNELFGEFWRTGDVDALDEVLAPEFVYHQPVTPPDLDGFKQALPMYRAAFPDMRYTVEDEIAEGDKVVDRLTWQATHQGELMGIPPTGNTVTGTQMHISCIADGKIVERWGQGDNLGLMRQLVSSLRRKGEARVGYSPGRFAIRSAVYCNRTATGLVRAGTQWTQQLRQIVENPIDKRNFRTQ